MTNLNAPQGNMEPHRGTVVLVLGILGLVVCFICGIIAWVMGRGDLEKMRSGMMDPEGEQMTKIGMILGMIATILFCCVLAIYIIFFVIFAGAGLAAQG